MKYRIIAASTTILIIGLMALGFGFLFLALSKLNVYVAIGLALIFYPLWLARMFTDKQLRDSWHGVARLDHRANAEKKLRAARENSAR